MRSARNSDQEERIDVDFNIWEKQKKDTLYTKVWGGVMTVVAVVLTFQTMVLQPTFWKAIMVEQTFLKALKPAVNQDLKKQQEQDKIRKEEEQKKQEQLRDLDKEYRHAQIELIYINLVNQMKKDHFLEDDTGYMSTIDRQLSEMEGRFESHPKELRIKVIKELPFNVTVKF